MGEKKRAQAAIEFLATYGWAFLIILIVIAALSYFGVLSPSNLLPDSCNFGAEFGCRDYTIARNGINLKLANNAGSQIVVDALAVSTEKSQLSCASSIIGVAWKAGEAKQVPVACDFANSDIIQGDKGKLNVKITYHLAKSSGAFNKEVNGEVFSTVSPLISVLPINVLTVYPCGCLINSIVANYGSVAGYPPIETTCVQRDSFTPAYDLSPYNVVVFDGADCWPGSISAGSEANLEKFVRDGGSAVFSHDFFLGSKHAVLQQVAGFQRVDSCCQGTAFNKLLDDPITKSPYLLSNPLPTQCTHGSGEVQKPESKEEYGGSDVYDHYLVTYQYFGGRSVFTEWGHCAYNCGCGLWQGLPSADESKSLINAIYWAAGVAKT